MSWSIELSADSVLPIAGVRLGVAQAGIKKTAKDDLTVVELAPGSQCVALFTRNAFCAAPVVEARRRLDTTEGACRYWVINTGNANAGTGQAGLAAAQHSCAALAEQAGCASDAVLPFSTGVIGELLPAGKLVAAMPEALADLTEAGWQRAAAAILTTDTRPKLASRQVLVGGQPVTLTGMAKGAGMIRPDMATMLAFFATDACVDRSLLDDLFRRAVAASFNRITVDGDTSTNDAAILAATGASGATLSDDADIDAFQDALTELCIELAQAIVRDGEGATKFVQIEVEEGADVAECDAVAYTIAHSPLVKTALFASDPNWGRLLAAIGRAGLTDLDVEGVSVYLNGVLIATEGARAASYTEAQGVEAMAPTDLTIRVLLNRGSAASTVWTTDLSYDYVRINAEYRT